MSRYRVCVYAICKNEAQFVSRWVASMREADLLVVLDTGSTDNTVEALRALDVQVTQEVISPWRFDVARNRSLSLVPADMDICVCTDLDELFHAGWREKIEEAWAKGAGRLRYRYTWNFLPDGTEGCVFWTDKVHARNGFHWIYPVHEVLAYTGQAPLVEREAEGVQLDHRADPQKSRSQYLPLLELSVSEHPEDDRNMHYLGREYLFHQRWQECETTLLRHLAMPQAQWRDERCASMRFLARAVRAQGREEEAENWLFRSIAEAPHLREPWLEAAQLALDHQHWTGALYFCERALSITQRSRTYINDAASWGAKPYDLAALAAYYAGLHQKALAYGERALALAPKEERLQENLRYYQEKLSL